MGGFYKKSKVLLFASYFILFFIVAVLDLTDKSGKKIMQSSIVMEILGVLLFLIGSHLLYFKKLWANDIVSFYERHLDGKPILYQKWLSVHKSKRYNVIMTFVGGTFFVLLGLLIFIKGFY